MKRHELSDEPWARPAVFFPPRSRKRGGFGAKVHRVTGGNELALAVEVTILQFHDNNYLKAVMGTARIPNRHGRPR